jgi:hypothetical protein
MSDPSPPPGPPPPPQLTVEDEPLLAAAESSGQPWWVWALTAFGVLGLIAIITVVVLANHNSSAVAPPLPPPLPTGTATATGTTSTTSTTASSTTSATSAAPTAAPVTAPPAPTAAPIVPGAGPLDVASAVFPTAPDPSFPSGQGCGEHGGFHYSVCPVTAQLASFLQAWPSHNGGAASWCRCPAGYVSVAFTRDDSLVFTGDAGNPHFAAVLANLDMGGSHLHIVLVMDNSSGSWLVADTYCGGEDPHNRMTAGTTSAPTATACSGQPS